MTFIKMTFLFLFSILAAQSFAGNGVERGSVMIQGITPENEEITQYLKKELGQCSTLDQGDYFKIHKISQRRERVDQGIIDIYYQINLDHLNSDNQFVNQITVEILDSDFHNWRHYEEKLSIEYLQDNNNLCKN